MDRGDGNSSAGREPTTRATSRLIWRAIAPRKLEALGVIAIILLVAALESFGIGMFLPLIGLILGEGTGAGARQPGLIMGMIEAIPQDYRLLSVSLTFLGLMAAKGAATLLATHVSNRFAFSLSLGWSERIIGKYLGGSLDLVKRLPQGELMNDLVMEPARASKAVLNMLNVVSRFFIVVSLIALMLLVDWRMTLAAATLGALYFFLWTTCTRRFAERSGQQIVGFNQRIGAQAAQYLQGLRELKLYGMEDAVKGRFLNSVKGNQDLQVKFRTVSAAPPAFVDMLLALALVGGVIAVQLIRQGQILDLLPTLGLFFVAGARTSSHISVLLQARMSVQNFLASLNQIDAIANSGRIVQEDKGGDLIFHQLEDDIEFRDVGFEYQTGKRILRNCSFAIERGRLTAIVGPSGSGKSTIVDILAGFYAPTEGEVLVNGRPLSEYDLHSWRARIGYVSQETFLFATTILETIRTGRPSATDEEILAAARIAHADEFIETFPDGYLTRIGDGGFGLSGGQKQRIALARVILRNPELYIFDEATSALDADTTTSIDQAIRDLSTRSTVIVISHRSSSIRHADTVYRLVDGRVVREERDGRLAAI